MGFLDLPLDVPWLRTVHAAPALCLTMKRNCLTECQVVHEIYAQELILSCSA